MPSQILLASHTVWGSTQLPHLHNIQAGSTRSSHINGDGLHQGTLGKVLDLLGHCGTEEESLPLALHGQHSAGKDLALTQPNGFGD